MAHDWISYRKMAWVVMTCANSALIKWTTSASCVSASEFYASAHYHCVVNAEEEAANFTAAQVNAAVQSVALAKTLAAFGIQAGEL